MTTIRLICLAFIMEMLCVTVYGVISYNEAVGKPKGAGYRSDISTASQEYHYNMGFEQISDRVNLNDKNLQSFCQIDNEASAAINANTPDTLSEMLSNHMEQYIEMPEAASIWHNFREDIEPQLNTPEGRLAAAAISVVEYYLIKDRSSWKYLDPSMPNRKFVEINGRREVVYNKDSGSKVHDINQGTANDGISQRSPRHLLDDIPRWILCGTPSETQRMVGEALAKNGIFKDAILSIRADKAKEFLKSIGFEDEVIGWFVKDEEKNKDSFASVDMLKHKEESPKSNSSRNNPSGDWDCCRCENPEDSDFQCKKCGKMSKWLAPEPDLEFLQWLKK